MSKQWGIDHAVATREDGALVLSRTLAAYVPAGAVILSLLVGGLCAVTLLETATLLRPNSLAIFVAEAAGPAAAAQGGPRTLALSGAQRIPGSDSSPSLGAPLDPPRKRGSTEPSSHAGAPASIEELRASTSRASTTASSPRSWAEGAVLSARRLR